MTVLFIAGAMRSGTTALGQALTASPDVVLVGELRTVLLGLREPLVPPCDCGEPEASCPFWGPLAVLPDIAADVAAASRTWRIPALALAALGLRRPDRAERVVIGRLRVVAATAGDRTIVDTSKSVAAALLWRLAGQQVVIARCVRSPRIVAGKQAQTVDRSGLAPVSRTATVAVWAVHHAAAVLAGLLAGVSHTTVRYGRFVTDPAAVTRELWRRVGARAGTPVGGCFEIGTSHLLVGNPRRERGRAVTIARREVLRDQPQPSAWSRSSSMPKWWASSCTTVTRISRSSSASSRASARSGSR